MLICFIDIFCNDKAICNIFIVFKHWHPSWNRICLEICRIKIITIPLSLNTNRTHPLHNYGCWDKHAHIPDNDYWGICLFHVVWTNFFCVIILMWYTRNIYIFFFINWKLRMSDNLPERVQNLVSRAYHLHYCTGKQNYLLSNILRFALKICFWADF